MVELREVLRGLSLFEAGDLINLRALTHRRTGMISKFSADKDRVARVVVANDGNPDFKGIFVQLQHIDPDALAAATNEGGVKSLHIDRYRWLLWDIDTLRLNKSKTNASDTERDRSWQVLKAVHRFLRARGWPQGVICDSGNGWHILHRVDLPNTPQVYDMLAKCLKAVAARFNNEDAEVDISTADPAQLTKLYGTTVRKAPESTDERPWRESRVLKVPDPIEVVSLELLASLAALYQAPRNVRRRVGMPALAEDFDIYDFAEHFELDISHEFEQNGGTYYVLSECPNVGRQHSGDRNKSCLIVGQTLGFHCFSDECTDFRIGDLLRKLAETHGHYPHSIFAGDDIDDVEDIEIDLVEDAAAPGAREINPTDGQEEE